MHFDGGGVWVLLFSIMLLRVMHVCIRVGSLLLLWHTARRDQRSAGHQLVTLSGAAVNTYVHLFLFLICKYLRVELLAQKYLIL